MAKEIKGYGIADAAKSKLGEKASGSFPFTVAGPLELIALCHYYAPALAHYQVEWLFNKNRFFEVTASDVSVLHDSFNRDGIKLANHITIDEQLSVSDVVRAQIDFAYKSPQYKNQIIYGDATAFENNAKKILIDGYDAKFAISGAENIVVVGEVRDGATCASLGHSNTIVTNTDMSAIAASGGSNCIINSGRFSRLSASGVISKLVSDATDTAFAVSGDYGTVDSFGLNAKIAISGDKTNCNALGENNVIAIVGRHGHFSGKTGTHVCVAKYDQHGKCIGFVTGEIGKNGLKENVTYTTLDGQFVELAEEAAE